MGKQIFESDGPDGRSYYGSVHEDDRYALASLNVSRDCEAELAILLRGAAARGIIRLDRILPFLDPNSDKTKEET